jgi:hypothetical protein
MSLGSILVVLLIVLVLIIIIQQAVGLTSLFGSGSTPAQKITGVILILLLVLLGYWLVTHLAPGVSLHALAPPTAAHASA